MDNEDESPDFLRNVESSARRILRKHNAIRSGKTVLKTSDPQQMIKASPFYEPRKERIPNRHKELSVEDINTQASELHIYSKLSSNKIPVYNRRRKNNKKNNVCTPAKGLKKRECSSESWRLDDIILDSSTLRNRFRSDQRPVCENQDGGGGGGSDGGAQGGDNLIEHPIRILITKHVDSITATFNQMTKKMLSSMSSKVAEARVRDLLDRREERISSEILEQSKDDGDIDGILKNECATQESKVSDLDGSVCHEEFGFDNNNDSFVSCGTQKSSLNTSNRVIPSVPPEIWPLVVFEHLGKASYANSSYVSIHRLHSRVESEKEAYWTLDLYDHMYQIVQRYILYDNEMDSLAALFSLADNNMNSSSQDLCNGALVHEEKIRRLDRNNHEDIYSVKVHVCTSDEMWMAIISICLQGERDDQWDSEAKIHLPIHEVIALLHLHCLCNTSNAPFWHSAKNGDLVWKRLINNINVEKSIKGERHLNIQPSWQKDEGPNDNDNDHDHDHEDSPGMGSVHFRKALETSYSVLRSLRRDGVSHDKIRIFLEEKIFQDDERKLSVQRLERDVKDIPPLSLRLTGTLLYSKFLVPGACSFGSIGPWHCEEKVKPYNHKSDRSDNTQIALQFQRDEASTLTKITTRLALETPIMAPTYHVFDPTQITPKPSVHEPVNYDIPSTMAKCSNLLKEPLISKIDQRNLPGIILVDSQSISLTERSDMENFQSALEDHNLAFTPDGYRKKCLADKVSLNASFPLHKFGITEKGVSPNQTGVNERAMWHSEEKCVHLLSKRRGPEDFFHMIQHPSSGKDGGSPNDPLMSIIYMKDYSTNFVKGMKMEAIKGAKLRRVELIKKDKKRQMLNSKLDAADRILKDRIKKMGSFEVPSESTVNDQLIINTDDTVGNKESKSSREEEPHVSADSIDSMELQTWKDQTYDKDESLYKTNKPTVLSIVTVSNATSYKIEDIAFQKDMQTKFISDLLEERFHLSHQFGESQQSKEVLLNASQQYALEHVLKVPIHRSKDEIQSAIPIELKANKTATADVASRVDSESVSNEILAIQAARHADFETLQNMLDDLGVDIDTCDEFGNTLLLLACQQGNKRLCKFLLRRGAYINAQNHTGNTVLHYLHEYGQLELADYLRRKGADDTCLNAEGLTCYEGVRMDNL